MATPASFVTEIAPEVKIDPAVDVQLATLDSQALTQSEQVRAMTITDYDSYGAAVAQGRLIATFIGEVESARERLTSPLFVPLNRLRSAFKGVLDVASADKQYLAGLCGAWNREVDRKRREEEQVIAQAQHEKREAERKLSAAIHMEQAGVKPAGVNHMLTAPTTTVAPMAPVSTKVAGASGRTYWKLYPKNPDNLAPDAAEAIAFRQLVVAAAEDPKLMCFLQRNVSLCDSEAKKGQLCQIPGYEALQDNRTSFRKV